MLITMRNCDCIAQSDQNDWRTPRKFLDAAREVLGEIDLDPASGVGISRGQKWRALRELQSLGLIEVEERPSRSPIIRLLR
jgi:hypothetical protein